MIVGDGESKVMGEFAAQSLLPTLIVEQLLDDLKALLREHLWDRNADELARQLSSGGPEDLTLKADHGLYKVALGRMTIDAWLAQHGHRAPEEFDLATPRWRQRPRDVKCLAEALKHGVDPREKHHELVVRVKTLASEVRAAMPAHARPRFDRLLDCVHRYMRFREDGKHYLMHGYDLLRDAALECGRRLNIGDGVFFLSLEELHAAMSTGYASLERIERRRVERDAARRLPMPQLIDADSIDAIGQRSSYRPDGDTTRAFPLSSGVETGPARIVHRSDVGVPPDDATVRRGALAAGAGGRPGSGGGDHRRGAGATPGRDATPTDRPSPTRDRQAARHRPEETGQTIALWDG